MDNVSLAASSRHGSFIGSEAFTSFLDAEPESEDVVDSSFVGRQASTFCGSQEAGHAGSKRVSFSEGQAMSSFGTDERQCTAFARSSCTPTLLRRGSANDSVVGPRVEIDSESSTDHASELPFNVPTQPEPTAQATRDACLSRMARRSGRRVVYNAPQCIGRQAMVDSNFKNEACNVGQPTASFGNLELDDEGTNIDTNDSSTKAKSSSGGQEPMPFGRMETDRRSLSGTGGYPISEWTSPSPSCSRAHQPILLGNISAYKIAEGPLLDSDATASEQKLGSEPEGVPRLTVPVKTELAAAQEARNAFLSRMAHRSGRRAAYGGA